MISKLYRAARDFSEKIKMKNINAFAASTAFFLFLSMVPMLVMLCTIIPFTPLTEDDLVTLVTEVTPDVVDSLVESVIAEVYAKAAGILSIAVIATLWSAGKGVLALMQGLNAINGVEEKRNYFLVRCVASLYTLAMLVIMILSLFVMVFGNQLVGIALRRFPGLWPLVSLLMRFRYLFVLVVLALFFTAIYTYVPNKKLQFKEQFPGALLAAAVWSVFSWGFSIYVGLSDSYSIYGSLSIIVIIMLWLYFCMYIVLVGAYLNQYFKPEDKAPAGRTKSRR